MRLIGRLGLNYFLKRAASARSRRAEDAADPADFTDQSVMVRAFGDVAGPPALGKRGQDCRSSGRHSVVDHRRAQRCP